MTRFRAIWRLLLVAGMTSAMLVVRVLGMPLLLVSPRLERRYLRWVAKRWGRLLARIIHMRVNVTGKPPEPPFVLVANHTGYVDTFLLLALTGAQLVSRADVAGWPLAGLVAKAGRTIFIDRARIRDTARVNEIIERELAFGAGIIFYPEAGTGPGDTVGPFKSALLEPAAVMGVPVHYCTLHFETFAGDPPASQAVVWHAPISFGRHVLGLLALRGFRADVAFGEQPIAEPDRKKLAKRLHDAVQSRFTPIV